jgi:hypothetical protein
MGLESQTRYTNQTTLGLNRLIRIGPELEQVRVKCGLVGLGQQVEQVTQTCDQRVLGYTV